MTWLRSVLEYFTPNSLRADSEAVRRAQLVAGLTLLGLVFGTSYATFYAAIGHLWGTAIIIVCMSGMVFASFLVRASGRVGLAGHLIVLIWTIGFSGLAAIEGGLRGHAVAWLGCGVPAIALLLLDRFTALIWCAVCFFITLLFCELDLHNITLPLDYPVRLWALVTIVGYAGLVLFMSLMGMLLEYGRKQALLNMQAAIAERMRTEEGKQAAEAGNRSKDRFLAMLSHELRTPLTPVLAISSSMKTQTELPPELQADMEMIHRKVELEAKLIDDLLDVTRIGRGKIVLKLAVVDALSCMRGALETCRGDMEAKQLQVSMKWEAAEHRVRADPGRLRQVFLNLLRNALKFTPAKGHISFRSSNEGGRLRIEITDTGIGIAPEVMPRIFNAFEQGEQTKVRSHQGGLGLGLSIAKAVVELHRGQLTAFSEGKDKGATFTVELPTILPVRKAPSLPSTPEPGKAPLLGTAPPSRILLVEDNPDTLRILARLLQRGGFQVATADCVQKALELSSTEKIDLVVSDLGLPDGSGLDLMRRLKELYRVPGIALSGYGTEEDIRRSRAAGFERHLVKPVDFNALRTAIQEAAGA